MKLDTVCKNGQHNGAKLQTLIPKNREMFIPAQPGRTNIQKWRGTLVLSLQTNGYKNRSRNGAETIKQEDPTSQPKGQNGNLNHKINSLQK